VCALFKSRTFALIHILDNQSHSHVEPLSMQVWNNSSCNKTSLNHPSCNGYSLLSKTHISSTHLTHLEHWPVLSCSVMLMLQYKAHQLTCELFMDTYPNLCFWGWCFNVDKSNFRIV